MKHTRKVTLMLVGFFFLAQIIGLFVVNQYIDVELTEQTGTTKFKPANVGPLELDVDIPEEQQSKTFIPVFIAILVGTMLALLLIKFRTVRLWKLWFFFAVLITLSISFGAFINPYVAFVFAAILTYFKVFRPNFYVHNFTELFIYAGLAALLVPMLNVFSAIILLFLISAYDMYAVWQSKHMIKLAKFQAESRLFAGLMMPYSKSKKKIITKVPTNITPTKSIRRETVRTAILGGGDIGFPLIFAGTVLKVIGIWQTLIISVGATIALYLLLVYGKQDRFYPAMPYISAGALIGYLIVLVI
ncbi:hypothetical protein GOV04_05405 [Candidatus Woesearchaeota archaeon]|nr:hypothetical protein [Candidatus Woesearchaeota archaeon]